MTGLLFPLRASKLVIEEFSFRFFIFIDDFCWGNGVVNLPPPTKYFKVQRLKLEMRAMTMVITFLFSATPRNVKGTTVFPRSNTKWKCWLCFRCNTKTRVNNKSPPELLSIRKFICILLTLSYIGVFITA